MNADLSIIIPMYNTGEFVNECIASITSSFLNIEIIVIDDGSEDDSFEKVSDLAIKDRRIILLRTENCGAGSARNTGLDIAKGTYIAFIDSDDWITKDSLDILYQEMINHDLDIVMGNALFYYHAEDIRKRYKIPTAMMQTVMQGKECYKKLSSTDAFIPMVYCYMYKHDFLRKHSIRFQTEMYEDELWTIQTVCQADRMEIIDYPFYYYRQRNGSIMHGETMAYKKSHSLAVLSKNILLFSQVSYFANDPILRSWLYVRAIQMFYYALTKFNEKDDFASFYNSHTEFLSSLVKGRNETADRITDYLFKYYLYRIIKTTQYHGFNHAENIHS